jgi:hypothetical protein
MTTMKNMRKASSQCLGCGKYKHFLSDWHLISQKGASILRTQENPSFAPRSCVTDTTQHTCTYNRVERYNLTLLLSGSYLKTLSVALLPAPLEQAMGSSVGSSTAEKLELVPLASFQGELL